MIALVPEERAFFDADQLEALCLKLGETCAEAEVARALERISTTLDALDELWVNANLFVTDAALSALARDADLIGMTTLARVAKTVVACQRDGSGDVAMAATFARLARVGDRSMHAVWDLEDGSP